jgi:hypothetical protein
VAQIVFLESRETRDENKVMPLETEGMSVQMDTYHMDDLLAWVSMLML